MKELSVEQKAKAYDEAIAHAKILLKTIGNATLGNLVLKNEFENMFPELKKSDKMIREALIDGFTVMKESKNCGKTFSKYNIHVDDILAWLEKQGEQKPTDKVESKFKVEKDKWYVCISQFCNCIEGRVYKATSDSRIIDDFGTEYDMHSDAYKYFRLWTIQDAKSGDVLYLQKDGKEHIIIYKGVIKERFRTFVSAYCAYNGIVDAFCFADVSRYIDIAYGGIMPATKEQRDTLMKAMADAGYTFDFEKKELKKIEQKPAWSEEDERIKESIITGLEMLKDGASDESLIALYNKKIDWLKSLKERYTWKPSNDEMEALANALSLAKNCGEECAFDLRTLLDALKKLR